MSYPTTFITTRRVHSTEGDLLGDILYPMLIIEPERFYIDHDAVRADPQKPLFGSLGSLAYDFAAPLSNQAGFFAFAPDEPETPAGFLRATYMPPEGNVFLSQLWNHEYYALNELIPGLLQEATEWAKSKGSKLLKVIIPVDNIEELKLYQEHGFDKVFDEPFDHQAKLAKTSTRLMTVGKKI